MLARSDHSTRITELNALRGLAVIGIVWMNVYVFALPAQGYYNPTVWGPGLGQGSDLDRIVWIISFVFIEDKFRTLFAMLFGAGCLILLERAKERPWCAHYARMAVLFIIGLGHAVLFASNDVLRSYALAGCALALLNSLSARALIAVCVGLVAVHVGGGMITLGSGILDFYSGRTASDAALFANRNFGNDPAAAQYMLDQGKEEWGERIERRIDGLASQMVAIGRGIPLNLAGMALGMGLWKNRMLAGEWRVFVLQRIAAICGLAAIPALFGLAWWVSSNGFPPSLVGAAGLILSAPFDTLLSVAYAAVAMVLFTKGRRISERLAAVGRLSLTNYLMTSIILAGIFASWGAGLFGGVSRAQALVLSFVPITAMLVWSPIWQRLAGQGPFERIWRTTSRFLS